MLYAKILTAAIAKSENVDAVKTGAKHLLALILLDGKFPPKEAIVRTLLLLEDLKSFRGCIKNSFIPKKAKIVINTILAFTTVLTASGLALVLLL